MNRRIVMALGVLLLAHFAWLAHYVVQGYASPDADGYFAQAELIAHEGHVTFKAESPLQLIGMHWLEKQNHRAGPAGPVASVSRGALGIFFPIGLAGMTVQRETRAFGAGLAAIIVAVTAVYSGYYFMPSPRFLLPTLPLYLRPPCGWSARFRCAPWPWRRWGFC